MRKQILFYNLPVLLSHPSAINPALISTILLHQKHIFSVVETILPRHTHMRVNVVLLYLAKSQLSSNRLTTHFDFI